MKTLITLSLAVLLLQPFTPANAERIEHSVVPAELEFTQAELEQMLAPIALYPDTLLSHILIAATYPLEIIQAERWSRNNSHLETENIADEVEDKDWDPSVKALLPFPRVLKKMSDDLEWTQRLGDAFLQDEKAVLSSIQILRQDAEDAGNLSDIEHMNVIREDDSIVIESTRPEVIYVPYYDPRIVYGSWRWHRYPPIYWDYPSYVSYPSHYYPNSAFYWGPRVHISFGFVFSAFHWNNHHLAIIPHYQRHRYYSRRQIIRHQDTRRWQHNPVHRRGASYRTTTVRNRFKSNRPSRTETRVARAEQKRQPAKYRSDKRVVSKQQRLSNNIRKQSQVRDTSVNKTRKASKQTRRDLEVKPSTSIRQKSQNKIRSEQQPRVREKRESRSLDKSPANRKSRATVERPGTKQRTDSQRPKAQYRTPDKVQKEPSYKPEKSNKSYTSPQQKSSTKSSSNNRSSSKSRSSRSSSKRSERR